MATVAIVTGRGEYDIRVIPTQQLEVGSPVGYVHSFFRNIHMLMRQWYRRFDEGYSMYIKSYFMTFTYKIHEHHNSINFTLHINHHHKYQNIRHKTDRSKIHKTDKINI